MIFAWDDRNREHIAQHNVTPSEAEEVIRRATPPYPMEIGEEKLIVWGATEKARLLQVIYSLKLPEQIEFDSLTATEWMSVASGEATRIAYVIHAMDLTPAMKKRFRKRQR
jgi:uncharacterized DUF497 family protein